MEMSHREADELHRGVKDEIKSASDKIGFPFLETIT
jgi:hypothetical protein